MLGQLGASKLKACSKFKCQYISWNCNRNISSSTQKWCTAEFIKEKHGKIETNVRNCRPPSTPHYKCSNNNFGWEKTQHALFHLYLCSISATFVKHPSDKRTRMALDFWLTCGEQRWSTQRFNTSAHSSEFRRTFIRWESQWWILSC